MYYIADGKRIGKCNEIKDEPELVGVTWMNSRGLSVYEELPRHDIKDTFGIMLLMLYAVRGMYPKKSK